MLPPKPLAGLVEDDSEPAGNTEPGGDVDTRGAPFAGLLDQQGRTAVPSGCRAIVAQQQPAARIGRAPDDPALVIGHQNQRMILLVAAEHDGASHFRRLVDYRQYAVR